MNVAPDEWSVAARSARIARQIRDWGSNRSESSFQMTISGASGGLTPDFREWLEKERSWGRRARHAIANRESRLTREMAGIDRFALRIEFVELTGAVAHWARGLQGALAGIGRPEAAAPFAQPPPFASEAPADGDFARLDHYLEARVALLEELLGQRQL